MMADNKDTLPCSIALATRNKAEYLDRTLASIREQEVPFEYEIITVDDGSSDNTKAVCRKYGTRYFWVPNERYRNPSRARNVGYRAARGEVIIAQSDDVVHVSKNTIEYLATDLRRGEFLLALVKNYRYVNGIACEYVMTYCGPRRRDRKPYFFLGSLWRDDLYAVGGNDEEFTDPCFDDNWFADCLVKGLGLKPRWTTAVEGYHQSHPHEDLRPEAVARSEQLYQEKCKHAAESNRYVASGGPWSQNEQRSCRTVSFAALPHVPTKELDGKIARTMNFFWAGDRMSFMRYLTLRSFRYRNPDWRIILHRAKMAGGKTWISSETQDSEVYLGPDYGSQIDDLDVQMQEWQPPFRGLAAAHASDLCQWRLLAEGCGCYCDMDILFVRPMPYREICDFDAVFCLTLGYMAIGFVGSAPESPLFRAVLYEATDGYRDGNYQSTGACAFYRLAGIGETWGAVLHPGIKVLEKLRQDYPELAITDIPESCFYPWTWKQVDCIFNQVNPVPERCIGIHWFGGAVLSQHWNCKLTAENIGKYNNTFTRNARECLR